MVVTLKEDLLFEGIVAVWRHWNGCLPFARCFRIGSSWSGRTRALFAVDVRPFGLQRIFTRAVKVDIFSKIRQATDRLRITRQGGWRCAPAAAATKGQTTATEPSLLILAVAGSLSTSAILSSCAVVLELGP